MSGELHFQDGKFFPIDNNGFSVGGWFQTVPIIENPAEAENLSFEDSMNEVVEYLFEEYKQRRPGTNFEINYDINPEPNNGPSGIRLNFITDKRTDNVIVEIHFTEVKNNINPQHPDLRDSTTYHLNYMYQISQISEDLSIITLIEKNTNTIFPASKSALRQLGSTLLTESEINLAENNIAVVALRAMLMGLCEITSSDTPEEDEGRAMYDPDYPDEM